MGADGAARVACVQLPAGIEKKGAQAAAPILCGNGRDLILGRCARSIRSYDYVAVGVAVLSTRGQAFVHQTGAVALGPALSCRAQTLARFGQATVGLAIGLSC